MDLKLVRYLKNSSGIYGKILREDSSQLCVTLEHAYPDGDGYSPKIPPATYLCVRGTHMLHSGPIETFEVTGVPGHTGILFHPGNTGQDSEGCILLGRIVLRDSIRDSRAMFNEFMALQAGIDQFKLEVSG